MAITQIYCFGDSLTQGFVNNISIYAGGQGCWVDLVAEKLGKRADLGPLLSTGLRQAGGTSANRGEWTKTGFSTITLKTDAFDRGLCGHAYYSSTSSDRMTWTKINNAQTYTNLRDSIVGFEVYWIDYTNGGNWQYSIDGGAWTNMNQTILHDNRLKKFYVASAINSTIAFRPSNGVSAVGCLIVGIEAYYIDPHTVKRGLIVHNLGCGGQRLTANLVITSSGDHLAILDDVRLGTGDPVPCRPNLVTCMFINDATTLTVNADETNPMHIPNQTEWNTALTTLKNRMPTNTDLLFINPHEVTTTLYNTTTQANLRSWTKSFAAANSLQVLDIYDSWSGIGITGNAAALAAGFFLSDGSDLTHLSQEGHLDVQERVFQAIQQYFLPVPGKAYHHSVGSTSIGDTTLIDGTLTYVEHGMAAIPITASPTY